MTNPMAVTCHSSEIARALHFRLWLHSAVVLCFLSREVSSRSSLLVTDTRSFLASRIGRSSRSVQGFRSAHGASGTTGDVADCTCDCCIHVPDDAAQTSGNSSGVVCAPRVGVETLEGDQGGCDSVCIAPDAVAKSFDAKANQIDYWRYCPAECYTVSEELNVLCVPNQLTNDVGASGDTAAETEDATMGPPVAARPSLPEASAALSVPSPAAASASAPSPAAVSASESDKSSAEIKGPGSEAEVVLAKAMVQRAREHAVAAGAAARAARQAYEDILASPERAAQEEAVRVLNELRKEAGVQAMHSKALRSDFEKVSREKAREAADKAALVYKKAWQRNKEIADQWAERAEQFEAAANDREDLAQTSSAEAIQYHHRHNEQAARRKSAQAKRSQDEASEFRRMGAEARAQVLAIQNETSWYEAAEKAAADNALAKALPPGVSMAE